MAMGWLTDGTNTLYLLDSGHHLGQGSKQALELQGEDKQVPGREEGRSDPSHGTETNTKLQEKQKQEMRARPSSPHPTQGG